jgi:hypothetical protein
MNRPRLGTPHIIGLATLTVLGAMAGTIEVLRWANAWLERGKQLECEGRMRSNWEPTLLYEEEV